MYRATFPEAYQVFLEEEPLPERLQAQELLVKNYYTLISPGTELAIYTHSHISFADPTNTFAKYPFYPGYAAVGIVEAVGAGIRGLAVGDVIYHTGRHASHAVVDVSRQAVVRVEAGVPLMEVPFARLAQIANTAYLVSALAAAGGAGATAVVIGMGLIGHLAAQLLTRASAFVIGSDPFALRRELAQQSGVGLLVDPAADDLSEIIYGRTDNKGAHSVIEATGDPALITPALQLARERGEVILLGSPRGVAELDVYRYIHRRGIHLKGAHEAIFPVLPNGEAGMDRQSSARAMIHAIAAGELRVGHLISKVIEPAQLAEGYDALITQKATTLSVLVDWRKI